MIIREVEFTTSAAQQSQYPIDSLPEIALSGRSNVGKSSFINSILRRKNVAYTSSRPGKTQTLNFFKINDEFYFVDVPGYGYAKVSKADRLRFGEMIEEYLVNRKQLSLVVLIVDLRHAPSEDDILMYNFLKTYQIPVLVVATKMDKVPKTKRISHEKVIKKELKMDANDLFIQYSSETHETKEIVLTILEQFIGG
jgi:GTP-binding protein